MASVLQPVGWCNRVRRNSAPAIMSSSQTQQRLGYQPGLEAKEPVVSAHFMHELNLDNSKSLYTQEEMAWTPCCFQKKMLVQSLLN